MLVLLTSQRRSIELVKEYDLKLQIFIESENIVRRIVCCSNIVSGHFINIKFHERDNGGSIFRKNSPCVYFCIDN